MAPSCLAQRTGVGNWIDLHFGLWNMSEIQWGDHRKSLLHCCSELLRVPQFIHQAHGAGGERLGNGVRAQNTINPRISDIQRTICGAFVNLA